MTYRKREDFKGGGDTDVELLLAAEGLSVGFYKLKDVPDCAIVAGYVREVTSSSPQASEINQNTVLFANASAPPSEVLPQKDSNKK